MALGALRFTKFLAWVLGFGNCLQKLRTRRSDHILVIQTGLNELSNGSGLCIESVLFLASLLHIEIQDLVLDHLRVFAFKRIALVENVIDATS